jgi:hypothetical protein
MAAVSEFEFSALGLLYAVTSVCMGVGYQMYMKSLMDDTLAHAATSRGCRNLFHGSSESHLWNEKQANDFKTMSNTSCKNTITRSPNFTKKGMATDKKDFFRNFVSTTTLHVQIAMVGMLSTFVMAMMDSVTHAGSSTDVENTQPDGVHQWKLPFFMLFINGLLNYVASLSSYVLLSLTTNLTWQITNAMKRLVVIVASVLYFRNPLTVLNICGIGLAVMGVSIYENVREQVGNGRTKNINKVEMAVVAEILPIDESLCSERSSDLSPEQAQNV